MYTHIRTSSPLSKKINCDSLSHHRSQMFHATSRWTSWGVSWPWWIEYDQILSKSSEPPYFGGIRIRLQYTHAFPAHLGGVKICHVLITSIIHIDFRTATQVVVFASHFTQQYRDFFTVWSSGELNLDACIHFRIFLDAGVQIFSKSSGPPYSGF